jgi:hypothetical protein
VTLPRLAGAPFLSGAAGPPAHGRVAIATFDNAEADTAFHAKVGAQPAVGFGDTNRPEAAIDTRHGTGGNDPG